jgi:hypothetical protein
VIPGSALDAVRFFEIAKIVFGERVVYPGLHAGQALTRWM